MRNSRIASLVLVALAACKGTDPGATGSPGSGGNASTSSSSGTGGQAPICRETIGAPQLVPVTVGFPLVAQDDGAIYAYGGSGLMRVERADPSKTTVLLPSGLGGPPALLDGDTLFMSGSGLFRIPIHGGAAPDLLAGSGLGSAPCALARLGDRLYFGTCPTLWWIPPAGGALTRVSEGDTSSLVTDGVDLFGSFRGSSVDTSIVHIHPDGTTDVLAQESGATYLFGVDDAYVYALGYDYSHGSELSRFPKAGGAKVTLATVPQISYAALDCSGVFFIATNGTGPGVLHRVPKGGGPLETVVNNDVGSFVIDATGVSFTTGSYDSQQLYLAPRQ